MPLGGCFGDGAEVYAASGICYNEGQMVKLKHKKYWQRGRDFLGVDVPLICRGHDLDFGRRSGAAVGEAGAFGVLAAGNMPVEWLEGEIGTLRPADRPASPST